MLKEQFNQAQYERFMVALQKMDVAMVAPKMLLPNEIWRITRAADAAREFLEKYRDWL